MVNHNVVVVSFLMLVLILGIEFSECRRSMPRGNKHKQKLRLKLQNDQYTQWLHRVSSAGKNLFGAAKNKDDAAFFFTVDSVDGVGDFTSIQDAIDALPVFNMLRAVIKISCGIYKEKVLIPSTKAFVTLEGDGADCTQIQWSDTAGTIGPNGKPLGTYSSATVAVNSPYFIAKNITFKNTAPIPAPGAVGGQGVALRISGDAASFYGCKFIGSQDTLYDQMGRHYFKDCYIEGSVDFIFGDGLSLYEGCLLHGVADTYGAVTAQKREKQEEDTGFAFVRCRVTGSGAYFLGRAWGSFSRVVFAYTYMDNIVVPSGWHNWGDPTRETTVFYGQYKCTGPGASFAGRVSWARELTDDEVKPFLALTFIDGRNWIIL